MKTLKTVFHNQWDKSRKFPGLITKGKSMTMPGQAVTAQEIIRSMTVGVVPDHVYSDQSLDSFHRMNPMEKIDYLNDLAVRNTALKDNIADKIARLRKENEAKLELQKREQIEAELRAKLKSDQSQ